MRVNLTILTVLFLLASCTQTQKEQEKTIVLKFQPIQCQSLPWQNFKTDTNENPLLAEITQIKSYLSSKGINSEVKIGPLLDENGKPMDIICTACDVCPEMRSIFAKVNSKFVSILQKDGWKIENRFYPQF